MLTGQKSVAADEVMPPNWPVTSMGPLSKFQLSFFCLFPPVMDKAVWKSNINANDLGTVKGMLEKSNSDSNDSKAMLINCGADVRQKRHIHPDRLTKGTKKIWWNDVLTQAKGWI